MSDLPKRLDRLPPEWDEQFPRAMAWLRERQLAKARRGFAPGSLRFLGAADQPDGSTVVRFETVPCPPAGW